MSSCWGICGIISLKHNKRDFKAWNILILIQKWIILKRSHKKWEIYWEVWLKCIKMRHSQPWLKCIKSMFPRSLAVWVSVEGNKFPNQQIEGPHWTTKNGHNRRSTQFTKWQINKLIVAYIYVWNTIILLTSWTS